MWWWGRPGLAMQVAPARDQGKVQQAPNCWLTSWPQSDLLDHIDPNTAILAAFDRTLTEPAVVPLTSGERGTLGACRHRHGFQRPLSAIDEAKPGQILISPRVLMKVETAVKVERVGSLS
jgi:hypothetical protein